MKSDKQEILIRYDIFKNRSDLSQEDQNLVQSAISAIDNAYAPYSGFRVGSAVLLENGKIIKGSNQENAAYPSGLCAERLAAFSASSSFPREKMVKIAIAAKKEGAIPFTVTPCGACRQVLLEYETKQQHPIKVLLTSEDNSILVFESINDLLPMGFTDRQLSQK